ncbi:L-2-amino-thiazoline-4-carboxylic acid hydrolase [Enterocloster sp. OA13]|uniref:L-2-amino-thiazoline-4-carboxylic acid hydrolase n=1 Tax=Enterocloster TaxID=2719313 RepID=UPI000471901D|nr:L-2-amino-thiazoline-4-carboxylic acid hydrolase [Lachnoclostridium pacaense]MCC2879530.1 L-2-amino-thiazoline-4-carboxylic acid hydrolase [Lachnoclostridium pacaense]MCH1952349.1 L-2-amino-thiazoline-4-carboxylic acid hydrolase [Enterocloster sp. OA13]
MGEIKNIPVISDEKVDINRAAISHRATWMALTYEAAKEEGADGEAFARKAIAKTGQLQGASIKAGCNPDDVATFRAAFLSDVVEKTFEMEVKTADEDCLEIDFHYCPLVAGWLKAGVPAKDIPALCDMAMDGDRNIAAVMGYEFHLGKTIAGGDDICEVCFCKRK